MAETHDDVAPRPSRIYVTKLAGTTVFDPIGDPVGTLYDVVVLLHRKYPVAVGLVVEVTKARRVFLPLTRVTAFEPGAVITTGLVNMRRFHPRPAEVCVLSELIDREVTFRDGSGLGQVLDLALEQQRDRSWRVGQVYVQRVVPGTFRYRRGESLLVSPQEIAGLGQSQSESPQVADSVLASLAELKAADVADALHDMPEERRLEVASRMTDERLADVLEELGEEDRVEIVSALEAARAADVLDVMQPDDAADLMSELPAEVATNLLDLMEPEEAADVIRLMEYDEHTAGGLMTTEPVILAPDDSVASLLAHVRRQDVPPSLAACVMVCRPPLESPTGKFLGVVHIQRALREPPGTMLGQVLDKDIDRLDVTDSIGKITRLLATYNLTVLPVVDAETDYLLGAVSVDDVLDHLLPEDWRYADEEETDELVSRRVSENG